MTTIHFCSKQFMKCLIVSVLSRHRSWQDMKVVKHFLLQSDWLKVLEYKDNARELSTPENMLLLCPFLCLETSGVLCNP